jgi:hypothetical protein
MLRTRLVCATLLVGAALVVASCGEPTGPAPVAPAAPAAPRAPEMSWITDIFKVLSGDLVDSCSTLYAPPVSKTIGRDGGVIAVGPDTLRIPRNALTGTVTIQASLPLGYWVNIIDFEPTGLTFKKPASLTMGYSNCSLLLNPGLEIAHVANDLTIIDYLRSTDNRSAKTVTAHLGHFSSYAVAY